MRRIVRVVMWLAVMSVVVAGPAAADQQPDAHPRTASSSKGRWIGLAIGAGAGFAAGVFVGLNRFDDAINSDRKVWTCAIAGAAGAGMAGFFLGRTIDRGKPRIVRQPLTLPASGASATLRTTPCSVRLGCPQK